MKLLYRMRATCCFCVLGWMLGFAPVAEAHNTVVYDLPSGMSVGGAGNITGPFTLLAMGEVRVLPQSLEIDLRMADGAAYSQLDHDPYAAPGNTTNGGGAGSTDKHFQEDQPLLVRLGATLFTLTCGNATLAPVGVSVELTSAQDVKFHLTYPPVTSWPLRVRVNCFTKANPGQKVLINVMDATGNTLNLSSVDAEMPALDVAAPSTPAPVVATTATKPWRQWLGGAAGLVAGVALAWLLIKLRQPARKA